MPLGTIANRGASTAAVTACAAQQARSLLLCSAAVGKTAGCHLKTAPGLSARGPPGSRKPQLRGMHAGQPAALLAAASHSWAACTQASRITAAVSQQPHHSGTEYSSSRASLRSPSLASTSISSSTDLPSSDSLPCGEGEGATRGPKSGAGHVGGTGVGWQCGLHLAPQPNGLAVLGKLMGFQCGALPLKRV